MREINAASAPTYLLADLVGALAKAIALSKGNPRPHLRQAVAADPADMIWTGGSRSVLCRLCRLRRLGSIFRAATQP